MATENLKKAAEQEAKALRINFDDAVKEARSNPIIVEFGGKEYDLPSTPPAWLPIFLASKQKNGQIQDSDNLDLIEGLLGSEFMKRIIDDRDNFVSMQSVNDHIIIPVLNHWGLGDREKK